MRPFATLKGDKLLGQPPKNNFVRKSTFNVKLTLCFQYGFEVVQNNLRLFLELSNDDGFGKFT
jgi:hypothetical protein